MWFHHTAIWPIDQTGSDPGVGFRRGEGSPLTTEIGQLTEFATRFSQAPLIDQAPRIVDPHQAIPLNPDPAIQQKFVGAAFEPAYQEAARFVDQGLKWAAQSNPITPESRVLDFGAGWGRISRTLLTEIPASRLYAVDVDQEMIALMEATLPGINAIISDPFPPTVLGDGAMTHLFAFSVFSHLSEDAHKAWAIEIGRLLAPGGLAFVTVLDELFFDHVAGSQAQVAAGTAEGFAQSLARMIDDVPAARAEYHDGKFIYCNPGEDGARSGDFYGWAVAPRPWVETNWALGGLQVVDWIPSRVLFEQSMVCLRKADSTGSTSDLSNTRGTGAKKSWLRRRG